MIKFPLYIVRGFNRKFEENGYICLETYYDRYVLDKPSLSGDYVLRRMQLLADDNKPYKLYKLRYSVNTLSQAIHARTKDFIDEEGNLFTLKKTKFSRIIYKKVVSCVRIFNGKYQCYVSGVNTPFITKEPYNYLALVHYNNSFVLFDVHDEMPEHIKHRIKL